MTTVEAKRMVLGGVALSTGVAVGRWTQGKTKVPLPSIFIGALFAGITLSMMSEFAPGVAGGMALILLIAALTSMGPILAAVEQYVSEGNPRAPAPSVGEDIIGGGDWR